MKRSATPGIGSPTRVVGLIAGGINTNVVPDRVTFAERHRNISVNFDFSEIEPDAIADMIREVAAEKPQAITVFCTNMDGASLAEELEREIGIPIYDTIATAVWGGMRAAGIAPSRIKSWGRLFREVV